MPLPLKQILLAGPDDAALAISAKASSQNSLGWMVSTVDSGSEALALLDQTSFDLVIASMALPGMSGLDLLRATMVRHPHTVRVLLLDRPQPEFILNAVGIVHQYLVKPCASDDLLATVCRLLAQKILMDEGAESATVDAAFTAGVRWSSRSTNSTSMRFIPSTGSTVGRTSPDVCKGGCFMETRRPRRVFEEPTRRGRRVSNTQPVAGLGEAGPMSAAFAGSCGEPKRPRLQVSSHRQQYRILRVWLR